MESERPRIRFVFDGRKYEYHGYVGAPDALLLKKHAGLTVLGFMQGIILSDPGALVGLVFIAKRHVGERVEWDELVESMVGENDLSALIETIERIPDEPEPVAEEPVPAAAEPPAASTELMHVAS